MAKWLRHQPGSPKHRDEPSQVSLMHPSNKWFLKLSNATRGHQCFVWNWKVYHINSPTRKSKWWATVSPYRTRGQKTSSPKSNGVWWHQTASLLWCTDPKYASTKRYSHRQSKELTFHAICLQKITSRQNNEKVFIHDTQTWGRTNIYLFFPAPQFSSLSHPNDHDQFQCLMNLH